MKFISILILSLSFSAYARSISDIKQDIFAVAESFKGQTDPDGSKQKQLEVFIEELKKEIPNLSMEEKAVRAIGTWNQVWGPYAFDGTDRLPPGVDVDNIYQFISPDGFYYNFGEYNFFKLNLKFFVKGNYKIQDDRISVQFTGHGLVREKEVNYATLATDIEARAVTTTSFPQNLPPVGVKGGLIEVYADDDIRINYGKQGEDIVDPTLFIMRRVR